MKYILLILAACTPAPAPAPFPDASDAAPRKTDAGGYPDDDGTSDACNVACKKLWAFGCPESGRTATGETCPALCRREKNLLDSACVAAAKSKPNLSTCHVRCLP